MIDEEFRTEYALYNGEYIHISSIYEVINGIQVNKEKELKALKEKAHNKELFCPCGCKSNVTVVAGPKMERRQHFRLLHSDNNKNCIGASEGIVSIHSRIVLNKWLKDKLNTTDIESRVPICSVSDTKRKYEFSFLCDSKKIAVNYCHLQSNISEEKLSILEENRNGRCIIHIVDAKNGGCNGQFPEHLKKIQNKQEYCLLLSIDGIEYHRARLKAVFYDKNIDGLWKEIPFADGFLTDFDINEYGLIFKSVSLENLLNSAKSKFTSDKETEQKRRDEEAEAREERLRKQQEEQKKRQEEARQNSQYQAKTPSDYKTVVKNYYESVFTNMETVKKESVKEESIRTNFHDDSDRYYEWKNFSVEDAINNDDTPAIDPDGNRWVRCEFCGFVGKSDKFIVFGGAGHVNTGKCKNCRNKSTTPLDNNSDLMRPKYDSNRCNDPNCNGTWVLRTNSRNGNQFWGCSNFPSCRETKPYRIAKKD